MKIRLADTRGFCAGVDRAIEIVKKVLEVNGAPVYVKHEVVHNKTVVNELKSLGAVFVEEIDEVPDGEIVIYSAHGVSKIVESDSKEKELDVFDATCPLVSKVHAEVNTYAKLGYDCLLIGHLNHPEVEGTMGQFDTSYGGSITLIETLDDVEDLKCSDGKNLAYVTQTTLSVDDTLEITNLLVSKFPDITGPKKDDICYATQNRQDAVKQLALESDLVLVIGSINSSNSNRLREIAERSGVDSYLIDSIENLEESWLEGKKNIGVTSGASAPEHLVKELINSLEKDYGYSLQGSNKIMDEGIAFRLPKGLR
ncbi:MAG TPA: 4-hydroxy-3-methylbut-2-enyl diphosphate reductase [SAR86 cluster bacterium]|nr:4-hydroxy-3-methylbut-2-enyl diphosphate reductase [SAR86 cluster bacterium]